MKKNHKALPDYYDGGPINTEAIRLELKRQQKYDEAQTSRGQARVLGDLADQEHVVKPRKNAANS